MVIRRWRVPYSQHQKVGACLFEIRTYAVVIGVSYNGKAPCRLLYRSVIELRQTRAPIVGAKFVSLFRSPFEIILRL